MSSSTKQLWKAFGLCLGIAVAAFILLSLGGVGPCGPGTIGGWIAMLVGMLALPISGMLFLVALGLTIMERLKERTQQSAPADGPRPPGSARG